GGRDRRGHRGGRPVHPDHPHRPPDHGADRGPRLPHRAQRLVAGAAPGASSARAAADVALHDAWARDAELALVELLGGDADDHLESDMTISLEDPAVMATRAQQAAEAGYRVLKIKLGQDIGEDRRRLDAVLEAM